MADHSIPRNANRIDVSQPEDLEYWSAKLGVSRDALFRAVHRVGFMADDVQRELAEKPRS